MTSPRKGRAKPIPLDAPEGEKIRVFIPMSLPAESRSGPPELPGLMDASVWIISRIVTPPAPGMLRAPPLFAPRQGDVEDVAVLDDVEVRDDMPPVVPDETGPAAAGDGLLAREE